MAYINGLGFLGVILTYDTWEPILHGETLLDPITPPTPSLSTVGDSGSKNGTFRGKSASMRKTKTFMGAIYEIVLVEKSG